MIFSENRCTLFRIMLWRQRHNFATIAPHPLRELGLRAT
jgi:hypothetical protein